MKIRTIIIFLLISLLLFIFLIWPKYQSFSLLRKEVSQKALELQTLQDYFQELQETSQKLKEHQSSLLKIDSALPSDPSLPELLNFLQKASTQSGLSLKKISPAQISSEEEVEESKIDLTLSGNYSAFKNFLSTLEKSARLIEFKKVSFLSPKAEIEEFQFNLIIKVYSY